LAHVRHVSSVLNTFPVFGVFLFSENSDPNSHDLTQEISARCEAAQTSSPKIANGDLQDGS